MGLSPGGSAAAVRVRVQSSLEFPALETQNRRLRQTRPPQVGSQGFLLADARRWYPGAVNGAPLQRTALALAGFVLLGGLADAGSAADANLATLLNLRGTRSLVRYSPGSLDRAAHVQARLDALAEDFAAWGGVRQELMAFVLGPEDWRAAALARAYGLPEATGTNGIALPAWGDDHTIVVWRSLLGGAVPWTAGTPVRGTPEEAATLAATDLLAQIELARQFVDRERLAGGEPWLRELLAATVARAAFERHEARRRDEIASFFATLVRGAPPAGPPTAYREGLPYREQLAASARFFEGAQLLLQLDGARTVKKLVKLSRKAGRPLEAADLLARYPGLGAWLVPRDPANLQ
jgi:hypothetical protein